MPFNLKARQTTQYSIRAIETGPILASFSIKEITSSYFLRQMLTSASQPSQLALLFFFFLPKLALEQILLSGGEKKEDLQYNTRFEITCRSVLVFAIFNLMLISA